MPHCGPQDDYRHHRPGQRHKNPKENRRIVHAVYQRGLLQGVIQGHEVVAHDDDVKYVHGRREYQRRARVNEAHTSHHAAGGYDAARERQGTRKIDGNPFPVRQRTFGKRVRGKERNSDRERSTDHRPEDAIEVADSPLPSLEDLLPGGGAPHIELNMESEKHHLGGIRKRDEYEVPKRIGDGKGDQGQKHLQISNATLPNDRLLRTRSLVWTVPRSSARPRIR